MLNLSQVLSSKLLPRYAVVGWLLRQTKNLEVAQNAKLARSDQTNRKRKRRKGKNERKKEKKRREKEE